MAAPADGRSLTIGFDLHAVRRGPAGGVHQLVAGLFAAAIRIRPGHRYHLFQGEGEAPVSSSPSVRLHLVPTESDGDQMDHLCLRFGIDVLFRAFPSGTTRFPASRQVVLVPDLLHEAHPELLPAEWVRIRRRDFAAALGGAAAIVTPSEFSAAVVRRHPARRNGEVRVVPPGPPPARGGTSPRARARPYFLFPANLWPHKNHARVFEAFRRFLAAGGTPHDLVLTGDPTGWDRLRTEAAGLPVSHLGFVSEADLASLYVGASAVLVFSLYEGFGLPLLEAFRHGVPVAGSDAGSLPEVGGEAMLACNALDVDAMAKTLCRITSDSALRQRLIAAGQRQLQRFDWDRSATELHAALELAAPRHRPRSMAARSARAISVVVPLGDHRGHALESVRALTRAQDCEPDRFELIVVGSCESTLPGEVAPLLDPARDQLVRVESDEPFTQCAAGARLARGDVLFFTESHCEVDPGCLRALLATLEDPELDGLCLACVGDGQSSFAGMEQRFFEDLYPGWRRPEAWQKVMLRGFAIRAPVYHAAGGFEGRYGQYAAPALAARLHECGRRIGYAPHAIVRHHNTTAYPELAHSIRDYVRGEWLYRREGDPTTRSRYFGDSFAALAAAAGAPRLAAAAFRALSVVARPRPPIGLGERRAALRSFAAVAGRCLSSYARGGRLGALRARGRLVAARLRFALWFFSPDRRYRAFSDVWSRTAVIARHQIFDRDLLRARSHKGTAFAIDEIPEEQMLGVHAIERDVEGPFRWTGPVAVLQLDPPPTGYRVVVDLCCRPVPARLLDVRWNGRRVRGLETDDRRITFELVPTDFVARRAQELALACPSLPASVLGPGDRRELGLAVRGIRFDPR